LARFYNILIFENLYPDAMEEEKKASEENLERTAVDKDK
jgi:hypothetical protein